MKNDLDEYRSRDGLSQGELAEVVGVSRQSINAIERERYDPSLELACRLAAQFDCAVEELFDPAIDESA